MSPRHVLARPINHQPYILRNAPASIVRARAHRVIHHPMTRVILFIGMIALSIYLAQKAPVIASATAGASDTVVRALQRTCEVLCDCVCDRLFPVMS